MNPTEFFHQIVEREIEKLEFGNRLPGELYLPVDYSLSNGGKRLRPVLTLMACRLFTEDLTPAINPALAMELFHNFTLLHDDIMDKADMRRNMPSVHKKWDENTAILSGDAMVVISFGLISSVRQEILPRMLEVFNRTALEVCEGQQMDMNFEKLSRVNEQMYMEMIKLKTSVLIAAAMEIGAIAGGASKEDASILYDCGLNMGLAFQLQDDLLDLYGEEDKFGKKPGGDILLNKKTFLLVKALELAKGEPAERISYLMDRENNPDIKVAGMKAEFDKLGIREMAVRKAEGHFKRAIAKLDEASPGYKSKNNLRNLIKTVMERNN